MFLIFVRRQIQQLQLTDILIFLDVVVQLVPSVVEKWGSSSKTTDSSPTSVMFAETLKKCLLDHSTYTPLIRKVGCLFDYEVMEEPSACKYVNILCRFHKKSELKTFEDYYYNDSLAKSLEQYFMSVGLHIPLGVGPGIVNKEFKLAVYIDRKSFTQKPTSANETNRTR